MNSNLPKPIGTESYQKPEGARGYLKFVASEDAETFRPVLEDAIKERLGKNLNSSILDAGCGPGWLTAHLVQTGRKNVIGCDASAPLIEAAKRDYPEVSFNTVDLTQNLPYQAGKFDYVILSMAVVALDLERQKIVFKNLLQILKPGGHLIFTTVNPYYAFPVGVWKRGLWRFLFRKTPKLKIRPYQDFVRKDRAFTWNENLISYFYTLEEQINAFLEIGYRLDYFKEITSEKNSKRFNLRYRLYRYPIFILLDFIKP